MAMKTRTITEDVDGSLNRRYFAEIEVGDLVKVRREGNTTALAARAVCWRSGTGADDAERKFIESGVLPTRATTEADDPELCDVVHDLEEGMLRRRHEGPAVADDPRDVARHYVALNNESTT